MAKSSKKIRPSKLPRTALPPIDVSKLKTYPLDRRHSKVKLSGFATPWKRGDSLRTFLNNLPDFLAVNTHKLEIITKKFGTNNLGFAIQI